MEVAGTNGRRRRLILSIRQRMNAIDLTSALLRGQAIICFGAGLVILGVIAWAMPRWAGRDLEQELAESARRASELRKAGDEGAARRLAQESKKLRTMPARGLGIAIGGVILILIGVARLK